MCCILVKYSSKIENTVESSNIGYSIGCFLMQGLLLGVWGCLILTEQLCRGSVVSLGGEGSGSILCHCLCPWDMEGVAGSR